MINLLKADIYKLFKGKAIYVCSVLSAVLMAIYLFTEYFRNIETLNSVPEEFKMYVNNGFSAVMFIPYTFISSVMILLIIVVTIVVVFDFSNGTIKNYASKGFKREKIYLSKFIVSLIVFFILIAITFLTCVVTASCLWGFGDIPQDFTKNLFRMIGLEMLAYTAILSVFIMISMLIRKLGISLAVNLSMIFLLPIVMVLLSVLVEKVFKLGFKIGQYWVLNYPEMLAHYNLDQTVVTRSIIVSLVTILVTSFIGIYTLKKRDIN